MDTKKILGNIFSKKSNSIIFISLITILSVLTLVLAPLFFGYLVLSVITNDGNFVMWAIVVSSLIMGRVVLEILKQHRLCALANSISCELKNEAYKCVLRSDIKEVEKIPASEIAQRISDNCDVISYDYITKNAVDFITSILYLACAFITLMVVSPICGIIIAFTSMIYYFLNNAIKKMYTKTKQDSVKNKIESKNIIVENIAKLEDVKSKNGVQYEINEFEAATELTNSKTNKQQIQKFWKDSYLKLIISSITICALLGCGFGIMSIEYYKTTFEGIICSLIYVPSVINAVCTVSSSRIRYQSVEKETKELDEVYAIKAETRTEPINSLDELFSIKFNNVSYTSGATGIIDINFELNNNEKLGILCLDDSSSDIIYNLLIKTIKPRTGSITFNNCESAKINTGYIRNLITAVSHNTGLFDSSISYNITYPLTFDEYKYNDSLYKARLKEPIFDLDNKDETNVNSISEEMKQQVCLGGAFYKDSKVFVFNNATNKLNPKLEEEVIKEIYKLRNKFLIMISNKAYTLTNCDKILVIEGGKVVEYGLNAELSKDKDSIFYKSIRKIRLATRKIS